VPLTFSRFRPNGFWNKLNCVSWPLRSWKRFVKFSPKASHISRNFQSQVPSLSEFYLQMKTCFWTASCCQLTIAAESASVYLEKHWLHSVNCLRAIFKLLTGHIWPAGPLLCTSATVYSTLCLTIWHMWSLSHAKPRAIQLGFFANRLNQPGCQSVKNFL